MAHLAELHEAGHLLAAGPLLGDDTFRGSEVGRALKEQDPAVLAGRFSVTLLPWIVPSGAMSFSPTHFPRSITEAESG